jgi:hypothetical protein
MGMKAFWTSMTSRAAEVGASFFSWAWVDRGRRRRGDRERKRKRKRTRGRGDKETGRIFNKLFIALLVWLK